MKKIALYLALAAGVMAGEMPVVSSMQEALPVAQAENRTILLNFTGKEWCPACIHLRTKIFASEEFKAKDGDKYIQVEVIFPRLPEAVEALGKEQMSANEELLNEYHITTGMPTIVMHDEKGLPFAVVVGARKEPAEYMAALAEAQQLRVKRDAAFAKAAGLQGMERAAALAEGLNALPENCRDKYPDTVNEINALDPQNTLGYKNVLIAPKLYAAQVKAYYELVDTFVGHMTPEDLVKQEKLMQDFIDNTPDLQPEVAQMAWRTKADTYAFMRNYKAMAEATRKAIDAAPNSKVAPRLKSNLQYFETNILPNLDENGNLKPRN